MTERYLRMLFEKVPYKVLSEKRFFAIRSFQMLVAKDFGFLLFLDPVVAPTSTFVCLVENQMKLVA